jgi:hypothetical protein
MPIQKIIGKDLIFNNGINTSLYVYETFREAGYPVILIIPVVLRNVKIFYSGLRKHQMRF